MANNPINEVSDVDMMEANGEGMDAFCDGMSIHDNPHTNRLLREAWHQGWRAGERHSQD